MEASLNKFNIETNEKSKIKLPKDYSTEFEIEKKVIDLINTEDPQWVLKINKNNLKVFGKYVNNILFIFRLIIPIY